MRLRPAWFATVGLLALAACATTDSATTDPAAAPPQPEDAGSWRELPASPLDPRELALSLWTGEEVLIIGGSDLPCPPNADCATDDTPFADGAALDPATGQWRQIADSPAPFHYAQGVVVGQTAYVLTQGSSVELYAYAIDEDSWQRLTVPFGTDGWYALAAGGDRLIAFLTSDEAGGGDDYQYDPAAGEWSTLPADPLGDAFDRNLVWNGGELLLFDRELVENPGSAEPAVARAAAYDPATGQWRRLPDSELLSTGPWLVSGDGTVVNPSLGGADGGEVNNWGRTYALGGGLDPATGAWSALPDPPSGEARSAGAFTDSAAVYLSDSGPALDLATGGWVSVPVRSAGISGQAVVAAGRDLVVFGGTDWSTQEGELLGSAWIWSPPE